MPTRQNRIAAQITDLRRQLIELASEVEHRKDAMLDDLELLESELRAGLHVDSPADVPAAIAQAQRRQPEPVPTIGNWQCPEHGPDKVKPSKFAGVYCTARNGDGTFCRRTFGDGKKAA